MPAKIKNKVAAQVEAIAAHIKRADAARPAVQREWKVGDLPGLYLVRTPAGVWSWHCRYMAGVGARRKPVREVIGRATGPTATKLADAKDKAVSIAKEGPSRGDDGQPKKTLRQLFDDFETFDRSKASNKPRAPRTMADYREHLERDVFKTLGHVPVDEITARDVSDLLTKVQSRSPNAAHKCFAALSSLYKWAKPRFLVNENIVVGLPFTHKNKPRNPKVTDADIAKLWRTIDSDEFGATPAMRIILKLGILTGQRNSEIAGACRSELHIGPTVANPYWQIPRPRMKRKKGNLDQFVFLSDQARALFAEALELAGNSEFVFPATTYGRHVEGVEREHIGQESVSRAWARLRTLAGVKGMNFHDCRKVITTWLGDRGERSDVLDRILDHEIGHHANQRTSITERNYNFAIMAEPLKAAWQCWADHVEAIVNGKADASAASNVIPLAARA